MVLDAKGVNMQSLWNTDDLARYLNKKAQWVRENRETLSIPAIKVGSQWRFKPDEIEAWLIKK
jgi:excisionase family DNA binding protein